MIKTITILFILSLTLLSCASKDNEAIATVTQLQEDVAKMQKEYNNVDYLAVRVAQKQYKESMFLIKKYYFKDTIDKEFMQALDIYRGVKTSTKGINKSKKAIENNLTLVENQLIDLKKDLENSSIQGNVVKEAVFAETKNTKRLDSALNIYLDNIKNLLFAHDSVAAYVKHKTRTF